MFWEGVTLNWSLSTWEKSAAGRPGRTVILKKKESGIPEPSKEQFPACLSLEKVNVWTFLIGSSCKETWVTGFMAELV